MREIIAFSMLPFGIMMVQNVLYNALNVYMADVLGIGLVATGMILALSRLWDAVNDPLMGMLIDRTRSKWGKCKPWVMFFGVPYVASFAFLFTPVDFKDRFGTFTFSQLDLEATVATIGEGFHLVRGASGEISMGNFVFAAIAFLIYYTFDAAMDTPYQSITPLVFPESKSRVKAIAVSNVVGSLGTILPSIIFFPIVEAFPGDKRRGFFVAALVFAVLGGLPIMLSCLGIKEKVYLKPEKIKYFDSLKVVFSNKNVRVLMLTTLFSAITNLGAMFLMFFCKWNCFGIFNFEAIADWTESTFGFAVRLSEEGFIFPVLSITSGISYMLSMGIVPKLLKKMDKKTLFIRQSVVFAIADVIVFFVCTYVFPYTSPDLRLARIGLFIYAILRFFTNFPVGMSLVLLTAMFSDTVDTIEMESSERLEGATFSFKGLINKFGVAGFNLIMMMVVNVFGYEKLQALARRDLAGEVITRSDVLAHSTTLNALFFMLTGLGAIGLILQAIPMFFYKFNEKENEAQIQSFRDQRDAELEAELEAARIS